MGAVAERANVGRSTAYVHYRTKTDMLRASVSAPLSVLAGLGSPDADRAPLMGILAHLRQHQHVARVLLTYPTRPVVAQALADLILPHLLARRGAPVIAAAALAAQLAAAQLSLLDTWLAGRPASTAKAMAQALQLSTTALIDALVQPGAGL